MQLRCAAQALWILSSIACSSARSGPFQPSDTSDPTSAGSADGGSDVRERPDGSSSTVSVPSTDGGSETANVPDGSRDAALDGMADAGGGEHLCYVYDDCNGGRDNDYSARACPPVPPAPGAPCTLPAGNFCFYCAADEDALHWYPPVPVHDCKNGAWVLSLRHYACE